MNFILEVVVTDRFHCKHKVVVSVQHIIIKVRHPYFRWCVHHRRVSQCKKLGKIFTGPTYKLLLRLTATSDISMSFIIITTTFTKHWLTEWISKRSGSFEIHWVRQYLVNFTGLVGIVNADVYKNEPIFTGIANCPNFQHWLGPLPVCSTWASISARVRGALRHVAGIILGMGTANGRRRYYVTPSLIGWAHTQNDPCAVVDKWLN